MDINRDIGAGLPRLGKKTLHGVFHSGGSKVTELDVRAAAMTNRTTSTLRSLSGGGTEEHAAELNNTNAEWSCASSREREVVSDIYYRFREGLEEAKDLTARACYDRLSGGSGEVSGPYSYGKISAPKVATKKVNQSLPPVRGEVCKSIVADIALPPPGAAPVRMVLQSAIIMNLFANFRTLMLKEDSEVDWAKYESIQTFTDPELQKTENLLQLASRMWFAGMLIFIRVIREPVSFFTVVKKVLPCGRVISRLVWDLRKANLRWRKPGRGALGSPVAFSFVELEPPGRGVFYSSYAGDVPEYYYTCELEPEMAEWFGLEGISAVEFVAYMKLMHNLEIDNEGLEFIGIRVLGMGWSWACMCAQLLLEQITERAPRVLRAFRVSDVLSTPHMDEEGDSINWGFIDDYAGVVRGERDQETTDSDAREIGGQVRKAFEDAGWPVHKETFGDEFTSLGVNFNLVSRRLRGAPALFWLAYLGTEYCLGLPFVSFQATEKLVGIWTWLSLANKGALSIFYHVYKWLSKWRGTRKALKWPGMVRAEFSSILGVSVFLQLNLSMEWFPFAYLSDSSPWGGAVLRTRATKEELREEARYAEKNGWYARLEQAGSSALRCYEEMVECESRESLEEVMSQTQIVEEQKWLSGCTPILELVVIIVSQAQRYHGDLGWWLRRCGATLGWHVRILCLQRAAVVKGDILDDECFADMLRLLCSGRVSVLVGAWTGEKDDRMIREVPRMMKLAEQTAGSSAVVVVEIPKDTLSDDTLAEALDSFHNWDTKDVCSKQKHMVLSKQVPASAWAESVTSEQQAALLLSYVKPSVCVEGSRAMEELRKERVPEVAECWDPLDRWSICYVTQWKAHEHNNIGELRMVVGGVRHAARSRAAMQTRILCITDSMVALGGVARGRSSSFPLNRLLRQLAAVTLPLGIKVYCRFVGSKRNCSDGPSRGYPIGQAPEAVVQKMMREEMNMKLSGKAKRVRQHFGIIRGKAGTK